VKARARPSIALGLAFAACAIVSLTSAPARADALAQTAQSTLADAERLQQEGATLVAEGKLDEAAKRFGEAYASGRNPAALFARALAEKKNERWVDALTHFRELLALSTETGPSEAVRARAQLFAEECARHVCSIEVRTAGKFTVDGAPSELAQVAARPGDHTVTFASGPKGRREKKVRCVEGESLRVAYDEAGSTSAGTTTLAVFPSANAPTRPPTETRRGTWLVPGIFGAGAIAALGVGVGFSAVAGENVGGSADTEKTAAAIGFVASTTFLVGAIVSTIVLKPWKPRATTAKTETFPSVDLRAGGFGGTF
jgi:hypothetical protein